MIHLVSGMYDSVFSNKEYKVLLVGLDDSGKTSCLERIKHYHKKQQQSSGATAEHKAKDGFAGLTANLQTTSDPGVEKKGKTFAKPFEEPSVDTTFIKPTIGLNICKFPGYTSVCDSGSVTANLLFWDLGGKAPLRKLWYNYAHQCHSVVLVVDASDRSRFPEVKKMAKELLGHPSLGGFDSTITTDTTRRAEQARAAGTVPFLVVLNKMDKYLADQEENEEEEEEPAEIQNHTAVFAATSVGGGGGEGSPIDPLHTQPPTPETSTCNRRHLEQKRKLLAVSVANLFDEIGLLDVALETSILPLKKENDHGAAAAAGTAGAEQQPSLLEISTTMRGSVGVGHRLFKVVTISALYEEEAIRVSQMKKMTTKGDAATRIPTVGSLREGLDWLIQYLSQNSRHVESL